MQPTVLAFNVSDDRLGKLRFACMPQGVQVKSVPAEDFAQPIGALCGLLPREEAPGAAEAFDGEMLILCSLSGIKAGSLLSALKRFRLFFPLKAVATPTNIHWQAPQLYRELSAEREAIANHQKPAHQEESPC